MKNLNQLLVAVIFLTLYVGCKKTTQTNMTPASLNIVNAINGSNPLVTNFSPLGPKDVQSPFVTYYADANQIGYASSWESGSYAGRTYLSLAQTSDTFTTVWSGNLDLPSGTIHTFFLSGDTTRIDTLFSTDLLPYYPSGDSVAGVRFVNLAENSLPMSINIQGNLPTQTEFSGMGYKHISAFKAYAANSTVPGFYNFEVRDQNTDSLLQTYTWNYTLSRNQTIVICGSEGAAAGIYPIIAFSMNNY